MSLMKVIIKNIQYFPETLKYYLWKWCLPIRPNVFKLYSNKMIHYSFISFLKIFLNIYRVNDQEIYFWVSSHWKSSQSILSSIQELKSSEFHQQIMWCSHVTHANDTTSSVLLLHTHTETTESRQWCCVGETCPQTHTPGLGTIKITSCSTVYVITSCHVIQG